MMRRYRIKLSIANRRIVDSASSRTDVSFEVRCIFSDVLSVSNWGFRFSVLHALLDEATIILTQAYPSRALCDSELVDTNLTFGGYGWFV